MYKVGFLTDDGDEFYSEKDYKRYEDAEAELHYVMFIEQKEYNGSPVVCASIEVV